MDLSPYFEKYRALVKQVDAVFEKVQQEYEACVSCKLGCSDCCYALFDLTLIEALHIKSQFDAVFTAKEREKVISRANRSDRQVHNRVLSHCGGDRCGDIRSTS